MSRLTANALAVTLKDPNKVYAATSSALMKSVDGGATWKSVFQGPAFDVAVDRVDPAVAYFLGFGLWTSDNGGLSWQQLLRAHALDQLAFGNDLPRTMLCSDTQSVFASFDSGASWSTLLSGEFNPAALAVDPLNSRFLYIGSQTGAQQSSDGGVTFHPFNHGLFGRGLTKLLFDPNNPHRLHAGTVS